MSESDKHTIYPWSACQKAPSIVGERCGLGNDTGWSHIVLYGSENSEGYL